MRPLALFIVLLGFWALFSGQLDPHKHAFLMAVGVFCSVLVTWICLRLGLVQGGDLPTLGMLVRLPAYVPWLLWQIVLSNLDVFRRVMAAEPAIDPRVFTAPCRLSSTTAQVIYANSITLTPGTVVIDLGSDGLLIHALTAEAEAGVLDGTMERRVARLESPA